jgi:hypothetical protein
MYLGSAGPPPADAAVWLLLLLPRRLLPPLEHCCQLSQLFGWVSPPEPALAVAAPAAAVPPASGHPDAPFSLSLLLFLQQQVLQVHLLLLLALRLHLFLSGCLLNHRHQLVSLLWRPHQQRCSCLQGSKGKQMARTNKQRKAARVSNCIHAVCLTAAPDEH